MQARKYIAANPAQAKEPGKNAAVAEQKLCGPSARPGVSHWTGSLSVKSHKGFEAVGALVCDDWPDHVSQ